MKALIFAAGLGSRLRPLTNNTPKALVPIGGKPMLEHVILKLKAAGFQEIVVNIHHEGQQIIDYLARMNHFGIQIHISDERNYLLDTGGGIKHAQPFLDGGEPFLVHNVDILSNIDLNQFYRQHNRNHMATLLVSPRNTSRYLLFDEQNRLCGWQNLQTGEVKSPYPNFDTNRYTEYAFGGIHILSPDIFKQMDEWTGRFSIIHFYLSVCAKATIQGYPLPHLELLDIGKPETLATAEAWLKKL